MAMPKIVKVSMGNQELHAIEQQFQIGREEWNEYKLLDGGVVRLKTTVQRIFLIVDENGNQLYADDGEPRVFVRHRSDVVTVGNVR